ncbi:MAG: TetR/AcrR family transcriptional regulator [Spirochaetes bacterium]|nr:TetR/AcrR family transcriptional regulator [Spirochaetota bacterium]
MQILKEELRQKILHTAIKEFLSQGYEAASLRKIAGICDIAPGSIYNYYPSKADLYLNVTLSFDEERMNRILSAMQSGKTLAEKILNYCYAYYDYVKEHTEKFRLFMHYELHGLNENEISEKTKEKLEQIKTKNVLPFAEVFSAGVKEGAISSDLNYETFIVGFTMSVRIALNEVLVLRYQDESFFKQYIQMLIFGIIK